MATENHSLPFRTVLGGIPFRLDVFDVSRIDEAHQLFQEAGDTSDGFTPDEVTRERIYDLARNYHAIMVYNEHTSEVVSACLTIPSQMCRSAHPMCTGGLAVVKKSYRGKGISKLLNEIFMKDLNKMGYIGEFKINHYVNSSVQRIKQL